MNSNELAQDPPRVTRGIESLAGRVMCQVTNCLSLVTARLHGAVRAHGFARTQVCEQSVAYRAFPYSCLIAADSVRQSSAIA